MPPDNSKNEKLPSKCDKILKDVVQRSQEYADKNIKQWGVTNRHKLHLFVHEQHYPDGADGKPSNAAFKQDGLSARVEGGRFGWLSKIRLRRQLASFCQLTGREYVGIVCFYVADIVNNDDLFNFKIVHDPFPFPDKEGKTRPQDPSHCMIVCDKNKIAKRDKLVEICHWSLPPKEAKKRDPKLIVQLDQVVEKFEQLVVLLCGN